MKDIYYPPCRVALIIFYLICWSHIIKAQETIERIIPWSGDESISAQGLTSIESEVGDIYILSNIQRFTPGIGIPIEGPITYGSGIIKVGRDNTELWRRLYLSNGFFISDLAARGRVPSNQILVNRSNNIILPYTPYSGILLCDSLTGAFSYKKAVFNINSVSGDTIQNQSFLDDQLCGRSIVEGIKETDYGYLLLYIDEWYGLLIIESLSVDLEVIARDTFEIETQNVHFSNIGQYIVLIDQYKVTTIDYEGNLINEFPIDVRDTLIHEQIKWAENSSYYIIGMSGFSDQERLSTVYVLDKVGNTLHSKFFNDKLIKSVEITDRDEVLLLFDLSRRDHFDSIPKPVQVSKYNTLLEEQSSKVYGFSYVNTRDISLTNDQRSFMVSGTRFKSILEPDEGEEANRIYFLKDNIDNLLVLNIELYQPEILFRLYPSLTKDYIHLDYELELDAQLSICNINGKILISKPLYSNQRSLRLELDSYNSGIYFILIRDKSSGLVIHRDKFVIYN